MLQTPLNAFHRECGARLVDFTGWEMPVMYTGIKEEHLYTRRHASFFDVSHMGRVEFRGDGAEAFLQRLNTRNVTDMKPGLSRYSPMCRAGAGGRLDGLVSRTPVHFHRGGNASNREKLLGWFEQQRRGFDVDITDRTLETAMVAIQGPEAMQTLGTLLPLPLDDLKRYHFKTGFVMGTEYFVARSGYTGEDGVEIILPAQFALPTLRLLVDRSQELGRPIKPGGLGARDSLRLEAGMPLYGHELTEDWDSITAGQAWCVDLTKDFIGQPVLKKIHEEGPKRRMAGFELDGKRIAREGTRILHDDNDVGFVTSGTLSPTFAKVIAMGLLDAALCEPGIPVEMELRGTHVPAKVVPLPFYKRPKK